MRRWALVPLALVVACGDPVRSNAIDKLGGENPSVKPGPLHRPGQPCVLCHDGNGPGNMVLAFGGTIYQSQVALTPAVGAIVHFRDSKGGEYFTSTNCAGNFLVPDGDYRPVFPVFVKIEFTVFVGVPGPNGQPVTQAVPVVETMTSPIYDTEGSTVSGLRDRSCASCHSDPPDTTSVGHVYLAPKGTQVPFPPSPCK
jgi:hypothetical protein